MCKPSHWPHDSFSFKVDMSQYPTISRIDAELAQIAEFKMAHPDAQPDAQPA
eukprot:m.133218 g.133218  ORF g.133218 m.133218 type:complete len:52 (+) comp13827_c0_seq4:781-936(+)